jgi:hypothetical protein
MFFPKFVIDGQEHEFGKLFFGGVILGGILFAKYSKNHNIDLKKDKKLIVKLFFAFGGIPEVFYFLHSKYYNEAIHLKSQIQKRRKQKYQDILEDN